MNKGLKFLLIILLLAAAVLAVFLLISSQTDPQRSPSAQTDDTAYSVSAVPTEQSSEPEATDEAPEQTADDAVRAQAEALLREMTLREKLCQLFILNPDTLTGSSPTRSADAVTKMALENYPVGGFSFSQQNIDTREQTVSMLADLQAQSKLGLFLCVDEEGGTVWRVSGNDNMGVPQLDSMFSYAAAGGVTAYKNAKTIAEYLSQLGFNTDFAPVADVWSNPDNTVIGERAYSDNAAEAAELVAQAVAGFHAGGVGCTLKHFPGHGGTTEDSHENLAVVSSSFNHLCRNELVPFQKGIYAGADMVMVGHLLVERLDAENPATYSYAIVTELLREKMHFDGVVITDALGMGALSADSEPIRCRKALLAGCDILLGITEPESTLAALTKDAEDGVLTEARIDESVLRILTLKIERGIIPAQAAED